MTHRIRHTHASGRFDRSARSLLTSLVFYALMSNIITLTEVVGRDRLHAVMNLKRFGFFKGPHSDAAIVWKVKRFAQRAYGELHVGTTDSGPRKNISASIVALHDKRSKRTFAVSSLHMVADVESDVYETTNGRPTERATDYHAMFIEWIAESFEFAQRWDAPYLILACDSNLNYHKGWVQDYIDELTAGTGLKVTWKHHMPSENEGTHGKRLIDLALAPRLFKVRSIKILGGRKVRKASDHDAFTEVLEF